MALTNKGLVKYCKECLAQGDRNVYVYGAIGQKLTLSLINDRAKAYPRINTSTRVAIFKKILNTGKTTYAYDCVGLIKSYLWGGYGKVKYNSKQDVSANGMYEVAKKKGTMKTMPEVKGLFVQMNGHIGVYIGNGYVIECTPNKKFAKQSHGGGGVCKTKLSARKWVHWGYIPWIDYVEEKQEEKQETPTTTNKAKDVSELTLVEYLDYIGVDYSKTNRMKLAKQFGMEDYKYTAEQNVELLMLCKKNLSFTAVVTAYLLNYRQGAGTKYPIVGAYKEKTVVKINEVVGNWGKTPKGWVNLKYVKVVK